ncbi:MAG: aldehyde dehydrogenase [Phycisphaerae bacterium]|nr:aldehyde dehydrogenase [Phycisphaerae bacterium]
MTTAQISEDVIRDVVQEVLTQLRGGGSPATPGAGPGAAAVPIGASSPIAARPAAPAGSHAGKWGIFNCVDEAAAAAKAAQTWLKQQTIATRAEIVQTIRDVVRSRIEELGKMEFEETKIGRLDHKFDKLKLIIDAVSGTEFLRSEAYSGDAGLTVVEHAPFGVIGTITPVTHVIPTMCCNALQMIAAGNTLVINPHPSGIRTAIYITRLWNQAIHEKVGVDNLICVMEKPTLETAEAIFTHPDIAMLCVTGGAGVANAAMASRKKAVVAGPGNPPVVVDETADIDRAAQKIIQGATYDNNLLCVAEKQVFAVASIFDKLMNAMERHGGYRLSTQQMDAVGAKCFIQQNGHLVLNRDVVGKDAQVLAGMIGLSVPRGTQILYGETDANHVLVQHEQMTTVIPIVRCSDVDQAIELARQSEHGFGHTCIMHSMNVANLTKMGRVMNTTLFFKNGATNEGEGFVSYSIATPTGEGPTSPLTFTRVRRCIMIGHLRII